VPSVFQSVMKLSPFQVGTDDTIHLMAEYSGGAYKVIVDYYTDERDTIVQLAQLCILREVEWFDDLTSVVDVTFYTLNPASESFTESRVQFLISIDGKLTPSIRVKTFPGTAIITPSVFVIVLALCVCSSFVSEFFEAIGYEVKLMEGRCQSVDPEGSVIASVGDYLTTFWNWVDMARIILFVAVSSTAINMNGVSFTECLSRHLTEGAKTTCFAGKFSILLEYDTQFKVLNSVLVMVHMIWILKYMKHKRLAVVRVFHPVFWLCLYGNPLLWRHHRGVLHHRSLLLRMLPDPAREF
jgi:hypothetical protein